MQLAWLEDFLALARLGSFTRAAEARGIAQPGLSRRVRALEHWAGAELFNRASHPVALTVAGRLLLPVAERAVRDLAGIREQARAASGTAAPVALAAPHSAAIGLLPALLGPGRPGATPGLLLRIETDDAEGIARRLRQGTCHLGLLYVAHDPPPPDTGALATVEVGRDRLLPVSVPNGDGGGAPKHALPGRPGAPARWLSLGAGTYIGRAVAAARRCGFPPHHLRAVAENGLAAALRTMALEGVGLAWLPESLVRSDLATGALVRAADSEGWDVALRVRLVRSEAPSEAADRFFDQLREAPRRRPDPDPA